MMTHEEPIFEMRDMLAHHRHHALLDALCLNVRGVIRHLSMNKQIRAVYRLAEQRRSRG